MEIKNVFKGNLPVLVNENKLKLISYNNNNFILCLDKFCLKHKKKK